MRTLRDAVIHFKIAKKKNLCIICDTGLVYFMIKHAQMEKKVFYSSLMFQVEGDFFLIYCAKIDTYHISLFNV